MLSPVTSPLRAVTARIADALVRDAPAQGPSAAVIGICDTDEGEREPVTVARGHARTLDEHGQVTWPSPLPEEPVFDVGSVTKIAATATLCMHLVDDGLLNLDSPVSQWLTGFSGGVKDTVTVRDLLEHQAGLWEWWPTYLDGGGTVRDPVDVVQDLPLRHRARSGRHYSDLGFMLLGAVVARAYGEPLADVAQRCVFEPLGMYDTSYRGREAGASSESSESSGRVVATSVGDWFERRMVDTRSPYPVPCRSGSFSGWRTHTLLGEVNDGNCWHAFGGVAGHAGLFTTATDLMRLGSALLTALDGAGSWSPDVVSEFFRPGRDPGQALGFRVRPGAHGPVVHHPGFPGARFAVLPERRRVAVLLTNRLHTPGEPVGIDAAWDQLIETVEAA